MRYLAKVTHHPEVRRVIVHKLVDESCLIYLYNSEFDSACIADLSVETLDDAFEQCVDDYEIAPTDWFIVGKTPEHCQDDWITPARIPDRASGHPKWGKLQVLLDGVWTEVDIKCNCSPIHQGLLKLC
jgi:hypothetical protein